MFTTHQHHSHRINKLNSATKKNNTNAYIHCVWRPKLDWIEWIQSETHSMHILALLMLWCSYCHLQYPFYISFSWIQKIYVRECSVHSFRLLACSLNMVYVQSNHTTACRASTVTDSEWMRRMRVCERCEYDEMM